MTFANPSDEVIRALLTRARVIAMVGASSSPHRPSHGVMARLMSAGYRVIPVNPNEREVLGVPAVAALAEISEPIDIVDVFRRPEHTPEIARDAVAHATRMPSPRAPAALWLQEGVVNEQASSIASAAGLVVVMDRCTAVDVAVMRVHAPA